MTDPERKLAGPLSDKIPTGTDDWGPAPLNQADQVELRIRVDPDALEEMSEQVESFGGSVKASYGRTIEATFPAGKVIDLAEIDAIRSVSEEIEKQEFKRTVSEGLEISNTDDIQNEGLTGSTSKVAIIDFYFDPSNPKFGDNVVAQIGSSDGFVSQSELHGTGCAEVIHDMAPDVDLVLGSIAGNDGLVSILNDIESQHPDTDVVSISLGSAPIDRLDGQDDESLEISNFTDGGRLAAISAGNEADGNTWHGPYQDSAGNNLMEFDDSGTEYLKVDSPVADSYIIANWDDWDDMNNLDYTLRIYEDLSDSTPISEDGPNAEPWAAVQFSSSPPAEAYVEIENVGADGNQEFDLWIWGGDYNMRFPQHTRARSMSLPSTSQDENALAVAAVQATSTGAEPDGGDLKVYSSQGPTRDGRQGVDVAGPSRVSQTDNGYGSLDDWDPASNVITGFNGTSAAAPHIAGIAGALSDADGATNEDVRSALESTGTEISDSEMGAVSPPSTKIGGGFVDSLAAYNTLTQTDVSITAEDITTSGGESQISLSGTDVSKITVQDLWLDWDTVSVQADGATTSDQIGSDGLFTFDWGSDQSSVSSSLTITPPERYVGGNYVLSATGTSSDETVTASTTFQMNI